MLERLITQSTPTCGKISIKYFTYWEIYKCLKTSYNDKFNINVYNTNIFYSVVINLEQMLTFQFWPYNVCKIYINVLIFWLPEEDMEKTV